MLTDLKIIEFVKKSPALWDRKHPDYASNGEKEKKWKTLSDNLSMPVDAIRKRWKSIKDRYLRLLKENNTERYKYGEMLRFLNDGRTDNQSRNVITFTIDDNYEITENTQTDSVTNENTNSEHALEELYIEDDDDENIKPTIEHTLTSHKCCNVPQSSREPKMQTVEAVMDLMKTIKRNDPRENKSAIEHFMQGLAMQIDQSNLTRNSLLKLQMKLLSCVEEAIISEQVGILDEDGL